MAKVCEWGAVGIHEMDSFEEIRDELKNLATSKACDPAKSKTLDQFNEFIDAVVMVSQSVSPELADNLKRATAQVLRSKMSSLS